jgi:ribonucleotide monophosphatase NagD (HAD superfamily)
MIGDSLDADVQGALDMGLAIFFNTDKVQVEQEIKQVIILELKIFITMRKQILAVLLFISSFGFSQL